MSGASHFVRETTSDYAALLMLGAIEDIGGTVVSIVFVPFSEAERANMVTRRPSPTGRFVVFARTNGAALIHDFDEAISRVREEHDA